MNTTVNVTAYIGRDYGIGEWPTDTVVRETCHALSVCGIDGATFTECVGMWRGECENSIRVDLLNVDEQAAVDALNRITIELAQWAIAYTVNGAGYHETANDPTRDRERLASQAVA